MSEGRFFRIPAQEKTVIRDINEEIEFHIEERVASLVAEGLASDEARGLAEEEFGDLASARLELAAIDRVRLRRERRAAWWDALWQDAAQAIRGVLRRPGFSAAVVLTLALGIGVNAAMFGITDRLLLSAAPHVHGADGLLRVMHESTPPRSGHQRSDRFSYPDYVTFRSVGGFEETGAVSRRTGIVGQGEDAEELFVAQATATFFPLLGVEPAFGRFFTPEEDAVPRGQDVAVLSHGLWVRRFGADRAVLGRTLEVDGAGYEVIGVAPEGFNGVDLLPVHVWLPASTVGPTMGGAEWYSFSGMHYLQVIARLADGTTLDAAREEANARFLAANEDRFGDDPTAGVLLGSVIAARAPEIGAATAQRSGRIALWLLGVSMLVVLIACANVVNLLLARGMRQRREVGVRMALGVSRTRLLSQILAEMVMLGAAAAALGLVLAHWTSRAAYGLLLPDLDWTGTALNTRVLMFAGAVALLCAMVASAAPALEATRSHVTALLGLGGRSTHRGTTIRAALVALQGAFSVLLLVGAGLFLRSLERTSKIPLGFDADRVAGFSWSPGGADWDAERTLAMYDAALERVAALPEVEAAALTTTQPYAGQRYGYIRIPGVDTVATRQEVYYTPVTPDYFRTTGARLVEGRGFAATDGAGAAPVTVITESLAELLWPGEGVVGRCIRTEPGANAPCREIIGVTEDVRYARVIGAPTLMFYLPMSQAPPSGNWRGLLVRFHGDPENGLPTVRRVMQTMEPGMPYVQGELLETRIAPELLPWRLGAVMFTAFGALALLLASLGLYSVVSYDIAQRRRELGVRVALGARAPNVLRLIVWDAVGVVGAGLLLGVVLAVLGARWIEPLLYDAPGFEPGVFGWVAAMLLTVAVVAAGIPGLRAARVHPTEALREE